MREFTSDTKDGFLTWLNTAARPTTAVLQDDDFLIGGAWRVNLRRHAGVLDGVMTEAGHLVWTRDCAVTELIRRSRHSGWVWVRSASTAWRVLHSVKGRQLPSDIAAALTEVLANRGAARYALDATQLEAILAASTRRGQRVDVAALERTQSQMTHTHRQLRELMDFDPLPDANALRTLEWLAGYGIEVPGISSEAWTERTIAEGPLAAAAEKTYVQALWLRRRSAKVREIARAATRGYVHSKLTPFAQVSGRISSTGPALNNVAADQRHLLMARPGHVLVTADFDGIEPRVLAGLSGDEILVHDLATSDPYLDAAGRAGYERTKAERNRFKVALLASAYGAQPPGVARQMRVPLVEAKRILDALWEPYPVAKSWLASQKGYAPLLLDSARPMARIEEPHARPNLIIQSTAYDIFQAAALRVHEALPTGAHIWLTIHDELVIETPIRSVDNVVAVLTERMPSECRGVPINARPVVLGTHWKKT